MSRDIDPTLMAALAGAQVSLIVMVMLKLRSSTQYVWSGVGPLVWNGNTYLGMGTLGQVSDIKEPGEGRAEGITLSLSGLDPAMLGDALTDIRIGAPAKVWLGAVTPELGMIGTPYLAFTGQVDKPALTVGAETVTISLALESRFINHARASQRRYTTPDQHANGYPDDSAFNWVEQLNDQALLWGQ